MKKKLLFLTILAVVAALSSVTALCCDLEWKRTPNEHWLVDEWGDKYSIGAHEMADIFCTVCQSEIWQYDDGSCDINNYDEHDELIHYSCFDEAGVLTDDYFYLYGYDENGLKANSFTYYFDTLIEEAVYGIDPFGESIILHCRTYNDDGSICTSVMDEYGNTVSSVTTDAAGVVLFEETYAYTYDSDGFPVYTIQNILFDDGTKFHLETNDRGNNIVEIQYDPDGSKLYEYHYAYEYDANGRLLHETVSEGDRSICENFYAYSDDIFDLWGYQYMSVDYQEDGGKIVYEMDEYGEVIRETAYDADGNIQP